MPLPDSKSRADDIAEAKTQEIRTNSRPVSLPPEDHPDSPTLASRTGNPVIPTRSIPDHLGIYVVKQELGRGGMGIVYRGFDPVLRRTVALKVLKDHQSADEEARQRFRTEAEAVAQLQHPNIVQIHEVGRQDRLPYVALEYLAGKSLQDRIDGKPKPPRESAQLVQCLAEAMAHAHTHGVLHRDLKPANVLFTEDGVPKITDFGVARFLPADGVGGPPDTSLTQAGTVIGTPQYMAPEQAAGDPSKTGPTADIYSLGAILYEMLTGRPPFNGVDPFDVIQAVRTLDPVSPRKIQTQIPRDLETICLKCLEKDPGRRYPDAAELARDLSRFLIGDAIRARPAGIVRRTWLRARRNPATTGLIAGTALAGVLGLFAFIWQFNRTLNALNIATKNEEIAERKSTELASALQIVEANATDLKTQAVELNTALSQSNWNLYRSSIHQVQLLMEKSKANAAGRLLDSTPVEFRNWEWFYLSQQVSDTVWTCSLSERFPESDTSWVHLQALSPDGTRLAVATSNPYSSEPVHEYRNPTSITLLRVSDGATLGYWKNALERRCILMSWVDNRNLVTSDFTGQMRSFDVDAKKTISEWSLPTQPIKDNGFRCPVIDAGRTLLARPDLQGQIELIDPLGRKPVSVIGFPGMDLLPLGFSPDGTRLIVENRLSGIESVIDIATKAVVHSWTEPLGGPTYSPDGKWVATSRKALAGESTNLVTVWDSTTWKPKWSRSHPGHNPGAITFSADSRRFVVRQAENFEMNGYEVADGHSRIVYRGHEAIVREIAFSPDCTHLVSTSDDRSVRIWDVRTGQCISRLRGHHRCSRTATFTPDGRSVITGGADELIIRWDLTRSRESGGLLPQVHSGASGTCIGSLGYTPAGRLAVLSTQAGLTEFDVETSNPVTRRSFEKLASRETKELTDFAFSGDAKRLAGRSENEVVLWDATNGVRLRTFDVKLTSIWAVTISPDGRRVAANIVRKKPEKKPDYLTVVWDADSGAVLWEMPHRGGPISLAFSPVDFTLAIGMRQDVNSENPALVIANPDGTVRTTMKPIVSKNPDMNFGTYVTCLAFSPDGSTVFGADWGTDRIFSFQPATGRIRTSTNIEHPMTAIVCHPGGKRLAATGYTDHTMLFDIESLIEVATLIGATGRQDDFAFPARVAFSPDGRTLAASNWHGGISIWNVESLDSQAQPSSTRSRAIADATAFRFHLTLARAAVRDRDSFAYRFHSGKLATLVPPTPLLRDEWEILKKSSMP